MGEELEFKRKRWKSTLQRFQNELWIDPPVPAHLYHYSTLDAITKIIAGRGIWLSNIKSVRGDANDGTHWIRVFRAVLNKKSVPEYIKDGFRPGLSFGLGSLWDAYVACFSPQQDLDHQWKLYADEHRGCALELSFDVLRANCNDGETYGWMPLLYDKDEQWAKAEKTIDAAIMLARDERLNREEARNYWVNYAAFSFLLCGMRFKDADYDQEREWRVFKISTDSRRLQHLTLPLDPEIVTGVIKGPACTCPNDELVELLRTGGYPPSVRVHCGTDNKPGT